MYMLRVLFVMCLFSTVISVSFQSGRLKVSVNETNASLFDLLEETCTPICHAFFKL